MTVPPAAGSARRRPAASGCTPSPRKRGQGAQAAAATGEGPPADHPQTAPPQPLPHQRPGGFWSVSILDADDLPVENVSAFASPDDADLYGRTRQGIAGYRVAPTSLYRPLPAPGSPLG